MKRPFQNVARAALLLCATLAIAQTQTPSGGRVTPNFNNVDVAVVAEGVGAATNTTFVLDPRVRAQITLVNPQPMTPAELYNTFLSILKVHGLAVVRVGKVAQIMPDAQVRTMAGGIDVPAAINPQSDEMVTDTITVKYLNPTQISTVLRQFVAQYGALQAVQGTNQLVIYDRAQNVARIKRLVAAFDREDAAGGFDVVRLEHATATDVVRSLTALTAGQPNDAGGGAAPRLIADDRINGVLISGDPTHRLRMAAWISQLDTPMVDGGGTELRYLKYADAEKIATKLNTEARGIAAAAGAAPAAGAAASTGGGAPGVSVWAYKETNALIITAPPKVTRELLTIVDKLDIPRAQVIVEAIIADVSTDRSADLGVNWAVFSNEDGTSVPAGGFISPVGTANGNGVSIVDLTRAVLDPASATTVPLGATFGVGRISDNGFNFAAMIRALRSDGSTNVIATPTLTTSDNQESEFKSAQEVPFITGQYTNTGSNGSSGEVNPFTTVQRQEVGTILKITPQINGGDALTLTISLESSELSGSSGDAGSAITNKRAFKTTVLVRDGGTLVIGGMIRDSKITGESRVPILGRIPLIGEAFKVRSGKRSQSNLMVFIRPRIIADSTQAEIETNAKYNLMRDAQRRQNDRRELLPLLPGDKPPALPPAAPPADRPAPAATTQPVPPATP